MQGSLFPDGVTVDHVALRRTELTKAAEILRNRTAWTSRGILSGGAVTVNETTGPKPPWWNTLNIAPFSGFTPNGEYIECTISYVGISLSSLTSGAINYVGAVYTEVDSQSQPHESDGEVYPTRTEAYWRIRVFTLAEYAALPESDDNLANDSQDRFLLLAIVTAAGSSSDLQAGNIQGPLSFDNILTPSPVSLNTITGVSILSVSPDTLTGDGTLSYSYTSPSTYEFWWEAVTGGTAASAVVPTSDGIYQIDDGNGAYITVELSIATLPVTGTFPLTETVNISNLYHQDVPRLTAEDSYHRNLKGTGTPTPTNPHGLRVDDLSGQSISLLNEHQNVMHCNGIARVSKATCLAFNPFPAIGSDDYGVVTAPTGVDLYYVNGNKLADLDITQVIPAVPSPPTPSDPTAYYYEVYVSDSGTLEYSGSTVPTQQGKAYYPASRDCTGTWIVNMSDNYPAGSYRLDIVATGSSPNTEWSLSWGGDGTVSGPNGDAVSVTESDASQVIRLFDKGGVNWIDVWVNTVTLPDEDWNMPAASTVYDVIEVRQSLSDGDDGYMKIAGFPYWYQGTAGKWHMDSFPLGSSVSSVDLRIWGNTGPDQLSTELLESMFYEPLNTQGKSGTLMRRTSAFAPFDAVDIGSNKIRVNGGIYYCRGKRIVLTESHEYSVASNTDYILWADSEGQYQSRVISGGDITGAMLDILGDPYDRENINTTYHASHISYAPERGVILAYVKMGSGTTVDVLEDWTRNINQVNNPWSVGRRIISGPSTNPQAQCAYDNLAAAFAYASYYQSDATSRGSCVITVEGWTLLDCEVTQPQGVLVQGVGVNTTLLSSSQSASVKVFNSTSATPLWKLSDGCKVKDLAIHSNQKSTAGTLELDSNCDILNCYFEGNTVVTPFLSHVNACENINIRGNTVEGSLFVNQSTRTLTKSTISDNNITFSGVSPTSAIGIYLYSATNTNISNNILTLEDNAGLEGSAILLDDCVDIIVSGNQVILGDSVLASNSAKGVFASNSSRIFIRNNSFKRTGGVTNSLGVHIDACTTVGITENSFYTLGGGIFTEGDARNMNYSDNQFNVIYSASIRYQLTTTATTHVYNIKIDNNVINNSGSGASPATPQVQSNPNGMIDFSAAMHAFTFSLRELSICGNSIEDSESAVWIAGIRASLSGSSSGRAAGVKICGNIISDIVDTSGSATQVGIQVEGYLANEVGVTQLDISNNQVRMSVTGRPVWSNILYLNAGIYINNIVKNSKINDNNIYIYDSGGVFDMRGVGIMAGWGGNDATEFISIENNVIESVDCGIYSHSEGCLISGNAVETKGGCSVYLHNPIMGAAGDGHSSIIQGNEILNRGAVGNPWLTNGALCINANTGSQAIDIRDNRLTLDASTVSVPDKSGCIRLLEVGKVHIENNSIRTDVRNITSGDAHQVFIYAASGGSKENYLTIKGNTFDDENFVPAQAVINGLYIDVASGNWAPLSDILKGHVSGNTFRTSLGITQGAGVKANEDADDRKDPGFSLIGPFTIFVSNEFDLGNLGGDTLPYGATAAIYFTGNSIQTNTGAIGTDKVCKVYLPRGYKAGTTTGWTPPKGGVCVYDIASLDNYGFWTGSASAWVESDFMWSR